MMLPALPWEHMSRVLRISGDLITEHNAKKFREQSRKQIIQKDCAEARDMGHSEFHTKDDK